VGEVVDDLQRRVGVHRTSPVWTDLEVDMFGRELLVAARLPG